MKSNTMPRAGVLAAVAVAGLALYGCSKSSESEGKSADNAVDTSAAPAAAAPAAAAAAAQHDVRQPSKSALTTAGMAATADAKAGDAVLTHASATAKPTGHGSAGAAVAAVAAVAATGGADEATPAGKSVVASDDSYELVLDTPDAVTNGADGTVRVKVIPKKGWKMNHEFPTQLDVTAPAGVTVAKAKQGISDAEKFEDKGAVFAVGFKPSSAGKKAFTANFKFAVCTEDSCVPKRQKLAWDVNVK